MAKQSSSQVGLVVTVVVVVLGAFYLLAPHNTHVSSGIGFGLNHSVHVILGVVLLVIGAAYYAKQIGVLKKK